VQQLQNIKPQDVMRYMILPGVIPRLRDLTKNSFGWLAYLMAITYQGVRLLPAEHPYLRPSNIGRFGIRQVIAAAAHNLVLTRNNIDQIAIFITMLIGVVALFVQAALMLASFLFKPAVALAVSTPFVGMFDTPNPEKDVALTMLTHVFGIPDLFCSSGGICPAINGIVPTPFHMGLHGLFEFYNTALLLVGVIILVYYIVIVVAETAHTGSPFGKRFSTVWAPIRLVVAIGLLVPVSHGLNSAQYITLITARMGSGFATNGWIVFNKSLKEATNLENTSYLARTTAPDTQYIAKFMMMVHACRAAYDLALVRADGTPEINIQPYFVNEDHAMLFDMDGAHQGNLLAWEAANTMFKNGDIFLRFGELDAKEHKKELGNVRAYCGELRFKRVDPTKDLTIEMAAAYLGAIAFLWDDALFRDFGLRAAHIHIDNQVANECIEMEYASPPCGQLPGHDYKQEVVKEIQTKFETSVESVFVRNLETYPYQIPQELLDRGWGAAGVWYNHLAEWNGAWIEAVQGVPVPTLMPFVMEQVQASRRGNVANVDKMNRYNPTLSGQTLSLERMEEWAIAKMLHHVYVYWEMDNATEPTDVRSKKNVFINAINMILGMDGLFSIRDNHDVNPLAQLVAMGKNILEHAIVNMAISVGTSAVAGGFDGLAGDFEKALGSSISSLAGMFTSFAMLGMTIGFILFYVLPFLPFLYFFFAVGAWIKTVFEAMVGVPLWALAHLRIDGVGLPGEAALNGYYLIFEILIRPILTVFGLIASLLIFTASVRVMHEVFPLAIANMTGFGEFDPDTIEGFGFGDLIAWAGIEFKRDKIDEFFFTIMYTFLVYMLGISSFKLIDSIPQHVLRWMGSGASTFADRHDDAADGLVKYAAHGGATITGTVGGVATQAGKAAGQAAGGTLSPLMNMIRR
jgi:conjugal transfer/type IV secretion protein DotA/TraY